jgi:hypothetical protein
MAKPDEWVDVEEYLHVVRTHVLSAAAYLAGGPASAAGGPANEATVR